jgi:DNA ligase-1
VSGRFCPLLSAKLLNGAPAERLKNIGRLRFPLLASTKYDGWRIFEYNGEASTRSLKTTEPKNIYTRNKLREFYRRANELCGLRGLDGELVVGDPLAPNSMQRTTSGMATLGEPELNYFIFDSYQYSDRPYQERWSRIEECFLPSLPAEFPWVHLVKQITIHDLDQMWAFLEEELPRGAEGIMLRKPDGHYKMGRSSLIEQLLVAVKKWETCEGIIIAINEQMHNANEARTNALGHTERSGHQENMHGKNTMGSVTLKSTEFELPFNVGGGPGLDDALRKYIWEHKQEFLGKPLTFRYQDVGVKDRPRFPQWMSIRDPADMGG